MSRASSKSKPFPVATYMLARMFFLFTVCALMSACTASANHWDAAHADTPLTTTTPYQFIGHY